MKRNIRALSMALALLMLALVLPHAALAATKPAELRVAQWRQNQSSLIIYTTAMGQNGYVADELSYDPNGYYVQLDDGYDLKITGVQAFSSTGESVHYILCCDISKSISSEQFEIERAALSSFGKSLDAKDHVSLITFGDTATTEASYVSGADLSNYVDKVDYLDSNTHLYEALNMAVDLTNSNSRTERCVLIVITDGDDDPGDTESLVSYQDINKTLSERQLRRHDLRRGQQQRDHGLPEQGAHADAARPGGYGAAGAGRHVYRRAAERAAGHHGRVQRAVQPG